MRRAGCAIGLLLAGCVGAVPAVVTQQQLSWKMAASARVASGGATPVEIYGAPPDGASPAAVAAALAAPASVGRTRFEAVSGPIEGVRIVLEFGATAGGDQACARPSGATVTPLVVSATLCSGDAALSSATLRARDIAGPSSPGFASATRHLLSAILTPAEPPKRGDD